MPMKLDKKPHYVYWIHLDTHKDILTEGYVGITCSTPEKRFKSHISRSRTEDFIISKAIRKYGNSLKVTTVCITDYVNSLHIENKLRPSNFIGWNMCIGGKNPPYISKNKRQKAAKKATNTKIEKGLILKGESHPMYGKKLSREHKAKMLDGLKMYYLTDEAKISAKIRGENAKGKPKNFSEDHKRKHKEMFSGVPLKEDHKTKLSQSKLKMFKEGGNWLNSQTNHKAWAMADVIYNYYTKLAMGKRGIHKLFGISEKSISTIIKHIKNGWIPSEDERWVKYYESNT